MGDFRDLSKYSKRDEEKYELMREAFPVQRSQEMLYKKVHSRLSDSEVFDCAPDFNMIEPDYDDSYDVREDKVLCGPELSYKVCPDCYTKFPSSENICPNCLVRLKSEDELNQIMEMDFNPGFDVIKSSFCDNFNDLLSDDNLNKLMACNFSIDDFNNITQNIKRTAFLRLNDAIKENSIDLDDMGILDIVILFVKSFVNVDYKAYGANLGYYEFNNIFIDDRQNDSQQIITLLHELTHFLIKEILTHVLCEILDISKNSYAEALVTFALSHSSLSKLVDEYAAHTVEARFTLFGYQDYSSFLMIEHDLDKGDVGVAKMIGNNFANVIKDILESFLDDDLRQMIKDQFTEDNQDMPNYSQLAYESCKILNDDGFMQAVVLILIEGYQSADIEILEKYEMEFNTKIE